MKWFLQWIARFFSGKQDGHSSSSANGTTSGEKEGDVSVDKGRIKLPEEVAKDLIKATGNFLSQLLSVFNKYGNKVVIVLIALMIFLLVLTQCDSDLKLLRQLKEFFQ